MQRFMLFVDGSNLYGSLLDMKVEVRDYQAFYDFVFEKAVEEWRTSFRGGGSTPPAQLRRVYWYVVGEMDDWNLDDAEAVAKLQEWFRKDRELSRLYLATVGPKNPGVPPNELFEKAWGQCLEDVREWYGRKVEALDAMHRFYHHIRRSTDFIDIVRAGHWKADMLHRRLEEKRLDTSMAVDMATLIDNYDVAVLVSGDADALPSVRYVKRRDKLVAAVELVGGYPPEKKGGAFSSHLRQMADFVVRVYEMDLVSKPFAVKAT